MQINYKNQIYYVKDEDLVDNEKCFVFDDPEFNQPSKINGKTLMFRVSDLEDKLKK